MQRRDVLSPGFLYFVMLTLFLYAPIVVLVVFSFNDSRTLVFPLRGFTLRWYGELAGARELLAAVVNSVVLGLMSSVVATGLGTAAAIGIARHNFPGRRFFLAVSAMPMVIPYVVLGVALLILFSWWGVPLSLWTVGVAHVVINVPYAMLIVASRLAGFDKNLEEAAMDLGETYWGTLRRITLPICAPAMLSAFLSSFTTSFDEFAVSFFLIGTEATLPVYLYSQLRFPSRLPLVVALASIIMVVSILLVTLAEWLRNSTLHLSRQGSA
ncbi:MAG: ABC transporter permease [Chloroflexi bacterium]|jgi:spermidine/putrescine transport system permease protein|nr:MAG: ABC transporter permease [Chloroflexota bacterium]RLT46505.1 MAG: ABC transporter permease [Chloroflexota bacterium]RLT53012.1 MAG: ABC transporter permease [Chloroflexota bacterium]